ncbi:MAG: hypothetical protein HY613_07325 [Candidatus Rokubacteria bacterium]|nr:hypothetical protein [Candidatus Rokubacteria bacterium]
MKTRGTLLLAVLTAVLNVADAAPPSPGAPPVTARMIGAAYGSPLNKTEVEALLRIAETFEWMCNWDEPTVGCAVTLASAQAHPFMAFLNAKGHNLDTARREAPALVAYLKNLDIVDQCVKPTSNPFQPFLATPACGSGFRGLIASLRALNGA